MDGTEAYVRPWSLSTHLKVSNKPGNGWTSEKVNKNKDKASQHCFFMECEEEKFTTNKNLNPNVFTIIDPKVFPE